MSKLRVIALIACLGRPVAAQEATIALRDRAVVISIGPVDIPAHRPYDLPASTPPVHLKWPASGWARGYSIDLVDSAGRVLPRTLLHHAAVANLDRRQLLNPESCAAPSDPARPATAVPGEPDWDGRLLQRTLGSWRGKSERDSAFAR